MGHAYDNGWDTKPKLDEARVIAPEEPVKHRARKDRRHWCKGKVGVDHVPMIQTSKNSRWMLTKFGPDHPHTRCQWEGRHAWHRIFGQKQWLATEEVFWFCRHERACANCGKILKSYGIGRECPDWKPQPDNWVCECWSCTKRYASTEVTKTKKNPRAT
jgi:hypothetical protein